MLVLLTSAMETGGGDVSQWSEIIFSGICINPKFFLNFSLDMLYKGFEVSKNKDCKIET